jgi:hypothetical protein
MEQERQLRCCLVALLAISSAASAQTKYVLSDLGTLGGANSSANDINNSGVEQGANKQAVNQLTAFINSVNAWRNTGKISSASANTLIAAANAIIAVL